MQKIMRLPIILSHVVKVNRFREFINHNNNNNNNNYNYYNNNNNYNDNSCCNYYIFCISNYKSYVLFK